jgi:hypothetical protein
LLLRFFLNGVSASKCQGQSGENLKKRQQGRSRRDFLMRPLAINGGDFLGKETYEEMQGAKERPT